MYLSVCLTVSLGEYVSLSEYVSYCVVVKASVYHGTWHVLIRNLNPSQKKLLKE